jgi:hypothetical protein
MGTTYHYANFTKREWFSAGAFGENCKISGLGRSLAARAFDLLLIVGERPADTAGPVRSGRWAGDAVGIIGDDHPDWFGYLDEYVPLDADVLALVYGQDGFDGIAAAARSDDLLFIQLCHLAVTRQVPRFEPHLREHFGADVFRRYKALAGEVSWFQPKDLGLAR